MGSLTAKYLAPHYPKREFEEEIGEGLNPPVKGEPVLQTSVLDDEVSLSSLLRKVYKKWQPVTELHRDLRIQSAIS